MVKRHPLAEQEKTPELSRIRYLTDEWLHERGFTLHELLGESCALVTDVSSAYVDYLVLDRPIVHHFPDIEAYGQSRGFSIEPIAGLSGRSRSRRPRRAGRSPVGDPGGQGHSRQAAPPRA